MNILQIIDAKVAGEVLTEEAITYFVHGYAKGTIPDYQIAALLMAIKLKGMNAIETALLTKAMVSSGDTVDLTGIQGITVDKHSTGGVGDKTSLVIGPIVASLGLKLAKMSGRGLGHTGGTIDKLESIPGFTTSLPSQAFKAQVNRIGMAIIGQTQELVPADKKLYALRDVTGTVESIPLIAASIMSKKIASGAKTILLDVKFGSGAFMKTKADATVLAKAMVAIGRQLGRDTRAMLTDMDQPLGFAIGNRLEVLEAANTLQLKGPKDFTDLCIQASAMMLVQANVAPTMAAAETAVMQVLTNGQAYQKFLTFVQAQGGDFQALLKANALTTQYSKQILAKSDGYLAKVNALTLGQIASLLGAGRITKEDPIDPNAGMIVTKKIGDRINQGDVLATLYSNSVISDALLDGTLHAFDIQPQPPTIHPVVHDWIDA